MHSKEEGKEKEGNDVAMGQGDYFAGIVALLIVGRSLHKQQIKEVDVRCTGNCS